MELASEHLKVPAEQLSVEAGVVSDKKNSRNQVTYTQLTKGKKIERHWKKNLHPKIFQSIRWLVSPFCIGCPGKSHWRSEICRGYSVPGHALCEDFETSCP